MYAFSSPGKSGWLTEQLYIQVNDWIVVKLVQNFASFISANVSHSHYTPTPNDVSSWFVQ